MSRSGEPLMPGDTSPEARCARCKRLRVAETLQSRPEGGICVACWCDEWDEQRHLRWVGDDESDEDEGAA